MVLLEGSVVYSCWVTKIGPLLVEGLQSGRAFNLASSWLINITVLGSGNKSKHFWMDYLKSVSPTYPFCQCHSPTPQNDWATVMGLGMG